MKWKAVTVGPTGIVHKDTNVFRLLYPFPTKEEAEAHAECFRKVGMKLTVIPEIETVKPSSELP